MKDITKRIIIISTIILIIIGIQLSPLADYFSFQNFQEHKDQIKIFINNHYLLSVLTYIGVYILVNLLFIPAAAILTLSSGFLFGIIPACIYVNIVATTSAALMFIMSRYLIGDWLQAKYKKHLIRFNQELKENGIFYLITVRLIPVIPLALLNTLMGLTKLSLTTVMWTTSLGTIPLTVAYVFAGKQLNYITKLSDILSFKVLLAFTLLTLLSLLPILFNHIKLKNKRI